MFSVCFTTNDRNITPTGMKAGFIDNCVIDNAFLFKNPLYTGWY